MSTMSVQGWCKPEGSINPVPIESMYFELTDQEHEQLEAMEEQLLMHHESEEFLPVDAKK
ncbi:MAG: hypothetical protein HRU20_10125 [Pseudomonadales bacterium]|nr:hypothetical protein [Pseudomonadales bacterium]